MLRYLASSLKGCLAPDVSNSVMRSVGPDSSASLAGTTGESDDGPIAVEKALDKGSADDASGIVAGGGGAGWVAWSMAVAVSVRMGPVGCCDDEVDAGLSDGAVFLDSRSVISTGVEAGTSSCGRVV